jgi:WD40 repeat protein
LHKLECHEGERHCHTQKVQAVALSGDGGLVASLAGYDDVGEKPAELVLWDARTGRPIRQAFEPSNVVTSVGLSRDGRTLVTAGSLGTLRGQHGFVHVWDVESFTQVAALVGHRGTVSAVGFSPDGSRLATGDEQGIVRLWDLTRVTPARKR